MPSYCYTNKTLGTIEEVFAMGEAPCIVVINGFVYERDFQAEHAPKAQGRNVQAQWPYESVAAGVHPDQVPEAVAYCKAKGVPTYFNPKTGDPEMRNSRHRAGFHKIWGVKDRDAGYGDYAGA
jgi:hypothetical protein